MAAQRASRFTPSSPIVAPGSSEGARPRRAPRSPGAQPPGRGLLLLALGGGVAVTGCSAPAAEAAPRAPTPSETPSPIVPAALDTADPRGPSPLWAAQDGSPEPAAAAEGRPDRSAPGIPDRADTPTVDADGPAGDPAAAPVDGRSAPLSGPGGVPRPSGPSPVQDRLAQGTIAIRGGESLWSLTAQLLGPHATDQEVARQWPLLWKANADRIRDPDQVPAGSVLHVPPELLPEP